MECRDLSVDVADCPERGGGSRKLGKGAHRIATSAFDRSREDRDGSTSPIRGEYCQPSAEPLRQLRVQH